MKTRVTKDITEFLDVYESIKRNVLLRFDHKALAPGYVSISSAYIETYDGHLGSGYIVHIPTSKSNLTGNKNGHIIEYWLTK